MKKFLIAAFVLMATLQSHAQLVINELMQSNVDCIMDDLNEFPDSWVELYNTGTTAVNLNAYKIGKSNKPNKAWALPNMMVNPGQYVIIYCDKANDDTDNLLHTDFRLESGKGCEVYLFQGSDIVDQITDLKKQPAPDIAYGRKTDGSDEWGYQLIPTPKAANCGQITDNILGNPEFSQEGRVYTSPTSFQLSLNVPEGSPDGTEIRYTTNGSEPTATSTKYTGPITISSTHVIRAKLFCEGWLSPRATVHSYIFFPSSRALTLSVVSISIDDKYLNDPKIGIYVNGTYQSGKNNYEFNWRRPLNIEMFEAADQSSVFNQLGEARIMGGASRSAASKSLAVYANKRFGVKRFDYEFFPDQKPGLKDFKSFMLRNAGNDFDYLFQRDAIIQRTVASHVDLDWQAYRPVIIYINGEYKGMLNIRERSNEDNIYTNYDGLEDIDMIENWWELKEGSIDSFEEFKAFYTEHGHTLAEYAERMDWEEFLNLMILNLYYCNLDFPGNNFVMWRPQADGGKWRFICKDTDFGLGLYDRDPNYKIFQWLYNPNYDNQNNWGANGYDGTRLFRRLMEDTDFHREFIDRTAIYVGDFLNEQGTRAVWDPMYEQIKTEYPFHRSLYNPWWPNYNDELNNARNWISKRTNYFIQQLKDYYQLGAIVPMTVNTTLAAEDLARVAITFNGIKLSEGKFNGKFFEGREVTLKGIPVDGLCVTGWTVKTVASNNTSSTANIDGDNYTFTMPACKSIEITAKLTDAAAITLPHTDNTVKPMDNHWYTLDGQELSKKPTTPGIYINNNKKIVIK